MEEKFKGKQAIIFAFVQQTFIQHAHKVQASIPLDKTLLEHYEDAYTNVEYRTIWTRYFYCMHHCSSGVP